MNKYCLNPKLDGLIDFTDAQLAKLKNLCHLRNRNKSEVHTKTSPQLKIIQLLHPLTSMIPVIIDKFNIFYFKSTEREIPVLWKNITFKNIV